MTIQSRLKKLEALHGTPKTFEGANDALLAALERAGARIDHTYDFAKASPLEVAGYVLCNDRVRTDVLQIAGTLAKTEGSVGKLFVGILSERGLTV